MSPPKTRPCSSTGPVEGVISTLGKKAHRGVRRGAVTQATGVSLRLPDEPGKGTCRRRLRKDPANEATHQKAFFHSLRMVCWSS